MTYGEAQIIQLLDNAEEFLAILKKDHKRAWIKPSRREIRAALKQLREEAAEDEVAWTDAELDVVTRLAVWLCYHDWTTLRTLVGPTTDFSLNARDALRDFPRAERLAKAAKRRSAIIDRDLRPLLRRVAE